jgi:hypothetical protein
MAAEKNIIFCDFENRKRNEAITISIIIIKNSNQTPRV